VTIVVSRPTKDKAVKKELTARVEAPRNLYPMPYYGHVGGRVAAEPLGIAYDLKATVQEIAPGSPASQADIKPGDQLLSAKLIDLNREKPDALDKELAEIEPIKFKDDPNQWMKLFSLLQVVKPDQKIQLEFKRGDKAMTADLAIAPAESHFDENRNLLIQSEIRVNQAKDWTTAFRLGRRETKEAIQEVFIVLNRLVTGRLSLKNLSGPPGILTAATHVASDGIPKFLIFLTMLSANLAVINFLPIPVLDGGHMVFLTAEWIRGRPVDADLQYKLTLAGVFFLLSLMVFASAMDVGRFFNM
jgi:regulator of sigma E protease